MNIFLDVGAHIGETARAVRDPKYGFDRIVCFDPVESCCEEIAAIGDERIEVNAFGLWKETCEKVVFDPGTVRGSVYEGLEGADTSNRLICRFVRASDWFRGNCHEGDKVYLKLNCEGSECDVIDDLLDSGEYRKVTAMMVDFDVRKVPSQKYREVETRKRLSGTGLNNFSWCEDVMVGPTHAARIQNWLRIVAADRCSIHTAVRQAHYFLRAPSDIQFSIWWPWRERLVSILLPGKVRDLVRSLRQLARKIDLRGSFRSR